MYNFDLIISLRNNFTGIDIESRNNIHNNHNNDKHHELLQFLELYKAEKGPVPINHRSYRNKNGGKTNRRGKNGYKSKKLILIT